MSMIRAQEYFAPLRSRHISLQQWERGLLLESWGSRGGRAGRRQSGNLDGSMASDADDSEEVVARPAKKRFSRSLPITPTSGREIGSSEVAIRAKFFARALSFSRSLTASGEIVPEISVSSAITRAKSITARRPEFRSKASTGLVLSRSFQRARIGSEISGHSHSVLSSPDYERSPETRPWAKKFFSGGLSFTKEKKMFSGVLTFSKSFGRVSGTLQTLGAKNVYTPDKINGASSDKTKDGPGCFKKKIVSRVLTFSRSLDLRGEISSLVRGVSTSFKGTDNQGRSLFGRGLSFSRSLDPDGACSPSTAYNGGSVRLEKGAESWSRKFIPRPAVFFSRSLESRSESPSHDCGSGKYTEKVTKVEGRSKKLGGRYRGFPFFRFLDSSGDSTLETPSSSRSESRPEKAKEFQLKNIFTRGFFFARCLVPKAKTPAEFYNGAPSTPDKNVKKPSRKFFSRDWSWSRGPTSPKETVLNISSPMDPASSPSVNQDFSRTGSNSGTSSRNSQALKQWWLKRSRSENNIGSQCGPGNDQNSKLVLLEKVPAADDQESDNDLTVYVGERSGNLTKYVLPKSVLQHHLFQVLLKCSQDELGSDHDYNSGVPIICDPALFLQVARAVGGNRSAQGELRIS